MSNSKRKKIAIIITISLLCACLTISSAFLGVYLYNPPLKEGFRVVAYITGDSFSDLQSLDKFHFSKVTHLIYAFGFVNGTTLDIYLDDDKKLEMLSNHIRTNYPEVKLMLSIRSAWENDGMCDVSHTEENRLKFANQCNELMKIYSLSGIDVDWEYPCYDMPGIKRCKDCIKDHYSLMKTLREELPNGTLLSIASPGIKRIAANYKSFKLAKILDFVNVMLYDISLEYNGPFNYCKNIMFQYCLAGYTKDQLNWGLPFYGRSETSELDYWGYERIMEAVKEGNAQLIENKDYSFVKLDNGKISFDSYKQIEKKTKYAKKTGYGGVFCWHMGSDYNNELMDMIWSQLKG